MARGLEALRTKSKIIIYLEMVSIVAFFCLTINELYMVVNMNAIHKSSEDKYFLITMNKRMIQDKYLANWDPLPKNSAECNAGFKRQNFLTLKTLKNLTLTDITDRVKQRDWIKDPTGHTYYNNTFKGYKFYTFDLQTPGPDEVTLLYDYVFHTLGSYNFCTMEFYVDSEYKAFNLVSPNITCSEAFPNFHTADCGTYLKKAYRMCVIKEYISFENGTSLTESTETSDDYFCPYNQMNIKTVKNPKYDPNAVITDSTDNRRNALILDITYAARNLSPNPSLIDKALFVNLTPFANVGTFYFMALPMDTYLYFDPDVIITYTVGKKYGWISSSNNNITNLNFVQYFNETFYENATYLFNNYHNKIEYYPTPLVDFNDNNIFYFPIDTKNNTKNSVDIFFSGYIFPVLTATCVTEVFFKNGMTELFSFFVNLSMTFYTETSSTLFAWLFAKLFISIYCYGKIRFLILIEKKNIKMALADINSETITKYTFKVFSAIVFVILFAALLINKSSFTFIMYWSNETIINKCFSENRTKTVQAYYDFTNELQLANDNILLSMFCSIGVEIFEVFLYLLYDCTDNSTILIENEDRDLLKKKTS